MRTKRDEENALRAQGIDTDSLVDEDADAGSTGDLDEVAQTV